MLTVLVTGKGGQLAQCIKSIAPKYIDLKLIFKSSSELNITNYESVNSVFNSSEKFDYCINCAAYTAVDNAETEINDATAVNVLGVKNLVDACLKHDVTLVHISTDFVFDGEKNTAYTENDQTNPAGIYGKTKLEGELVISEKLTNFFIIRTSWLYSEYGNNFMNTMLRISKGRNDISVVDDQIGTPTYAIDLAIVIFKIIQSKSTAFGVYHYSNEGVASWYDFACAIFDESKVSIGIKPIKSKDYPTPAKRPKFSVLDKTKLKKNIDTTIPHWRDSLKNAIRNVNSIQN